MKIGASIPICEQDAVYLPTLFKELERMDVQAAWLLNNCSDETTEKIAAYERTVGFKKMDITYNNCLRNYPMEILYSKGFDWMIQWDADETWEPKAPEKLRALLKDQSMITVKMAHVWEIDGEPHLTTDWAFERDRIYNLHYKWLYMSMVVAGASCLDGYDGVREAEDIWMIHWGYSTHEKRHKHKARWDTNHGHSVGKNPYGMWDTITEAGYQPKTTPYQKFIDML